jgi:hypothetical protein
MTVSISTKGLREYQERMKAMSGAIPAAALRTMSEAVKLAERDLRENAFTGRKGSHEFFGVTGAQAPTLGVRSGQTRRSLNSEVVVSGNRAIGTVGTPLRHVAFLEEGGTIHGRPWLKIPLRAAQTAAGVDRGRRIANSFILRSRRGNLFVARRATRVRLDLFYLLKHSVHMEGRHMFRESARRIEPQVGRLFEVAIRTATRGTA